MGYEHQEDAVWGGGSWQRQAHTHTHTVSPVIHRVVKPRAMIRCNHDTCKRGPTLIKLVGYEHLEKAVGGGGSKHWQTHTHTVSPVIHRVVKPRAMIRCNHDTCKRGPTLIKLVGYEHLEKALGGGGSKHWQTHTHTMSPVIHRVDGASGNDRKQS